MKLPSILPGPDDVSVHQFKFWLRDKDAGTRVPYLMHLDKMFNVVALDVDPGRTATALAAKRDPRAEIEWRVLPDGRKIPTHIPEDLKIAHQKVVGHHSLTNILEEQVRQQYETELAKMQEEAGEAGCSNCDLGALIRKYQDKMLEVLHGTA
jgi:hypothetical protein